MSSLTPRKARDLARLTGAAYLLIFVLAIFANATMMGIGVKGDPAATMAALLARLPLFRLAAAAFIVVLIADVLISWALFYLLAPVGRRRSLLTALFRLVYTGMFAAVALDFVRILEVVEMDPALDPATAQMQVYLAFRSYGAGFAVSLIFFAAHLGLLGYLIIRSEYLPSVIGGLVMLAGFGYALDGFGTLLFETYGPYGGLMTLVVIVPALVGEGLLCLWLLFRGVDAARWPVKS